MGLAEDHDKTIISSGKGEEMKEYKCPVCELINNSNAWNLSTKQVYGDIIEYIENSKFGNVYVCPNCHEETSGEEIDFVGGVEMVTIPKDEYNELLEIKYMYEDLCE